MLKPPPGRQFKNNYGTLKITLSKAITLANKSEDSPRVVNPSPSHLKVVLKNKNRRATTKASHFKLRASSRLQQESQEDDGSSSSFATDSSQKQAGHSL